MFSLSILDEKWIPVIYFDGCISKIKPSQLVDEAISDLAYFRPDFRGAAYQFLIGLLQTTFSPGDNDEWLSYWYGGISQSQLDEAFKQAKPAMQFGKKKPAFMQDFTPLNGNKVPISGLLVEAPGENTLKKNTDHFIKRDFVKAICPHCAVMALFSLQTNAPSGGQGHRVSLRGGGPITTLMMPELNTLTPLWKKLWLNVIPIDDDKKIQNYDETVFPWLNKTITSEPPKNLSVFPEQANCCQAFWGMPRRIELDFDNMTQGSCDLCGENSSKLISHYKTKNYGIQYQNWRHPLSPYRYDSRTGTSIAIKGQPEGLIYRDWLGMVKTNNEIQSAQVVAIHYYRTLKSLENYHLWCFGYDFDNMKARSWYERTFPIYPLLTDADSDIKELIELAIEFSKNALLLLRNALISINKQSSSVDIAYWKETEIPFYQLLKQLTKDKPNSRIHLLLKWMNILLKYITQVYDKAAFSDPDQQIISPQKINAREKLLNDFNKLRNIKKLKIINRPDCI